jgi:peptidoglycan-associated lipoprotein
MTIKGFITIITQGESMKARINIARKLMTIPSLLATAFLFTACSQQPAVPAADGYSGNGSAHNNNTVNDGKGSNSGGKSTNTQGANVGNGSGVQSTGSGVYGYNQGQGQAGNNTHYYQYGKDQSANSGKANANGSANRNAAITLENLKNPNSLLSKRIIYFDYDQATIKPQYQAILNAHAKLLAKYSNINVRLEGHADERGTREYNVALSEERAKAVQWIMRGKGVKSSQTEVIAYGEERPAVVSSGEKSWAKNRRVEIKYPGR